MNRLILLSLVVLLPACSHLRTTNPGNDFAEINRRATRATVWLTNGLRFQAIGLHLTPDRTTWIDFGTAHFRDVPTEQIARVVFTRRGRGALEGLVYGLAAGAVTGAVLGLASGGEEGEAVFATAEEKALAAGFLLGGLGGLVGLPLGTAIGSKDVYRITVKVPAPDTLSMRANPPP